MRKLLNDLPVVCIVGLAVAAHFLPVLAFPPRKVIGWEVAHEVLVSLYKFPMQAMEQPVSARESLVFIGCFSNPLFWFGVVAASARAAREPGGQDRGPQSGQ